MNNGGGPRPNFNGNRGGYGRDSGFQRGRGGFQGNHHDGSNHRGGKQMSF